MIMASIRVYVKYLVAGEVGVENRRNLSVLSLIFDFAGVFEDSVRGFDVPYFCWSCLMCSL